MPDLSSIRVLIVDDEHIVADTLTLLLAARGYNARAAYSGEQAATIVDEFKPHAVISDVLMPGMNGFELADWLEDQHPNCKVLLISGNTGEETLDTHVFLPRRRSILPKPIYPTDLFRFLAMVNPPRVRPTPDLSGLRVLIVDDERSVADSLGMIAETKGCTVRIAYDGEQATSIAGEFNPHACITDVVMPAMDGVELAKWLRRNKPQCRVLLISAYIDSDEVVERLIPDDGDRRALSKPIHPTEIFKFLAACSPPA
jgi:DNA-binding response OmpR family regulator